MSARPPTKRAPAAATLPGVTAQASTSDASERVGIAGRARTPDTAGQLERANALAHAREDGEREATIATFCECAAIATSSHGEINVTGERILAELHRRFGADDPRVLHHKRLRGLA